MNMIRTDKMWTYSNTGVKIHGFVKDGQHVDAVALCSSRITRPSLDTAQDMEEIVKYGRRGSLCTRCVNRFDEYAVAPVAEQPEPFETKESSLKIEITPEVIAALATLRTAHNWETHLGDAVDVLDNAGVFRSIDEATGYDVSAQPEPVSKCARRPSRYVRPWVTFAPRTMPAYVERNGG